MHSGVWGWDLRVFAQHQIHPSELTAELVSWAGRGARLPDKQGSATIKELYVNGQEEIAALLPHPALNYFQNKQSPIDWPAPSNLQTLAEGHTA